MCNEVARGLEMDLMVDFFKRMLDTMGQFQNSEALHQDYCDFCRARNVEPVAIGAFCEEITRLVIKVKGALL